MEGRQHALEAGLLAPEGFVHRLFHREIEHADFAVPGQGVGGDLRRVVIEGLAEHEEARMLGADALGECLPERGRHPRDGVDAEGVRALVDPLQVGAAEVVQHCWIGRIEIPELGQVAIEDGALVRIHRARGVPERVQRVVPGVELVGRQVLVVGDEFAVAVEYLAELRLRRGHHPCRRTVIAHDVQHQLHVARMHRIGQPLEVQAGARQVFVELVEVVAPVAVVATLALVGEDRAATGRGAATEGFVRVVHDRRDPHRGETHLLDVVEVLGQALEVAAQVADVAGHPVARRQRDVEGAALATLVALVVAGVAVDEAVGDDEIHGLRCEGLAGAEVSRARGRRRVIGSMHAGGGTGGQHAEAGQGDGDSGGVRTGHHVVPAGGDGSVRGGDRGGARGGLVHARQVQRADD